MCGDQFGDQGPYRGDQHFNESSNVGDQPTPRGDQADRTKLIIRCSRRLHDFIHTYAKKNKKSLEVVLEELIMAKIQQIRKGGGMSREITLVNKLEQEELDMSEPTTETARVVAEFERKYGIKIG